MKRARELAARVRWRSLIPVVLFGLSILFTVHYVDTANHKFCQVVSGVAATPVQRPADPAANPSRETSYEWYERFVGLDHSLGCAP